jgi:hypothetical protein
MRSFVVRFQFVPVLSLALASTLPLAAQDAGQIAIQQAQMANQQAMQANQQAADFAQRASQQAIQDNMTAAQNAETNSACCYVFAPKASVKAGKYSAPVTVKLKDRSRSIQIYYTLDGWSPTTASMLYEGPITISSTANLQAIAVDAHNNRSMPLSEIFTITGGKPGAGPGAGSEDLVTDFAANEYGAPILMPGTALPLMFTKAVSSQGLEVGDLLPVALAKDVTVGGKVIAAKGTPVIAKVTQVDSTGRMGVPGTLSFAVRSITLLNGTIVPLVGQESKEGAARIKRAMLATVLVPGVPAGLFVKGQDAMIQAGAKLSAMVGPLQNDSQVAGDWQPRNQATP